MEQKVKVNIITGFLGVGKTTTVLDLLKNKEDKEPWAVLVNEFGEVSIDNAILQGGEQEGVEIREVVGGCICCTASMEMQIAITQILRKVKPSRILIEPSGVGPPERIIDSLKSEHLKDHLEIYATICMVDPKQYLDDRISRLKLFKDQINMSDVLVANKIDLVEKSEAEEFLRNAAEIFPPKLLITTTTFGHLKEEWLDLHPEKAEFKFDPTAGKANLYTHAKNLDHAGHEMDAQSHEEVVTNPTLGNPIRKDRHELGNFSTGWIFTPDDVFLEKKLDDFFAYYEHVDRIKGVFRTRRGWILYNALNGQLTKDEIAYRRDSRVEVINVGEERINADKLETQLINCLDGN